MSAIQSIQPNIEKALFLAKRSLSELVFDAVNLEGIPFTLSEVQTLLDGVTVGGHKLMDQQIALNQIHAWQFVFDSVAMGSFSLSAEFSCQCHQYAGEKEAPKWGQFRTGNVTIAGTKYAPPAASELPQLWEIMIKKIHSIDDVYEQAISLFLQMARHQFFYDLNKRMGRFMMNGLLLSKGYPVINLPASKQLEFNELMIELYNSNEMGPMIIFMKNCLDPQVIKIMSE